MSEITRLLQQSDGSGPNLDAVFNLLHAELKQVARNRLIAHRDATLTPTSLVNEIYIRFTAAERLDLQSRHHFFACAARAMRQVILDYARSAQSQKRGGGIIMTTLSEVDSDSTHSNTQIFALEQALEELSQMDQELVKLVELKFFAGMSMQDIAECTQRSSRSLHRDWQRAKAFLQARISQ